MTARRQVVHSRSGGEAVVWHALTGDRRLTVGLAVVEPEAAEPDEAARTVVLSLTPAEADRLAALLTGHAHPRTRGSRHA